MAKFKSGQYANGMYEFDTTETFIRKGDSGPMKKPGKLKAGDVVSIQSQPKHIYRVAGKRREGNKLIILCYKVNNIAKYKPAKHKPKTGPALLALAKQRLAYLLAKNSSASKPS